MHCAAKNGQEDAIKALEEAGADVSPKDIYKWPPMHLAAENGHVDVMFHVIHRDLIIYH